MKKYIIVLISLSFQLYGIVEDSILPLMETVYSQCCGVGNNTNLKDWKQYAIQNQQKKLRIMTFNMLYNVKNAEDKLPLKHRWLYRKPRLLEYLAHTKADIICSQELQEDQVEELMDFLGRNYSYYGLKTRGNEGRTDTNAIFFNAYRFDLMDAKTIPYNDPGGNAFTYCYFRDRLLNKNFIVVNTKLSWGISSGAMKKRFSEATQLNQFTSLLSADEPILVMGDFNILRFFDEESIIKVLTKNNLKDAKTQSIFGHFGPFCSITNSSIIFTPFTGPELKGYILDRIFVNELVWVLTHAIDTAKVNGEFPSDHFPVIADIFFK
ncbi:MAG: endonuclease/exonuclease/phosphatase family protein [Chlamydiales bacterium]